MEDQNHKADLAVPTGTAESLAEDAYSERLKCGSCINGSGPNGCTDCLNTGRDFQAFVGGIEGALNDAYAEGRRDEAFDRQRELPRPSDMPVGSMTVRDRCTETQWNHRRNDLADGKYLVYAVRITR